MKKKKGPNTIKCWNDGTVTLPNGKRLFIEGVKRRTREPMRFTLMLREGDTIRDFPLSAAQTREFSDAMEPIVEQIIEGRLNTSTDFS